MRSLTLLILTVLLVSCSNEYPPEELKYINEIEAYRAKKNEYMLNNPDSPFNYKVKVEFHNLNYFDVDPAFRFHSKLYEYEKKDTITIFGTKGESRETVRYGYITFVYNNNSYSVNVYEGSTKSGEKYYSIWFTDRTTSEESYGVGRYLDFELNSDTEYIYDIDFNLAYNPYCAYSKDYSCAIPTKEDYLDLAVKAGEKKFHD
ncbi:MAG: DUF1684 domain-containing protein [Melioribacteraceae bacterium]|nr:DUF1684 domain-containing protein [Melioribacteraceae bacterium]